MTNKITLLSVFSLKERIHIERMKLGFMKFDNLTQKIIGGGLITIFITIFHYIFAFPHLIFECAMWCFIRDQYKMNMKSLYRGGLKKLVMLHKEIKRTKKIKHGKIS